MGFLDDLKRQAEAAKAQQTTDLGAQDRNAMLADAACNSALRYFTTLTQQLNVLQPTSKATYRLDKQHAFSGLRLCDFRVDSRMKRLRGQEVFDHVVLRCRLQNGGRALRVGKDFPEIERFESRLRQSGALFQSENVRNPANGRWQETRFEFKPDFGLGVHVQPDHDAGWVRFKLTNFDGFETVTVDFPAFEIGTARLDELARWLVGEPHAFLDEGRNLRRVEA